MMGLNVVNDDIVLKNGNFEVLEDDISVSIERLLSTNLGEFLFNLDMGLEYDVIHKKKYKIDEVKEAISDCVELEERVLSVDDINVEVKSDRSVLINFKRTTEDGTLESEVVL